MSPLVSTTNVHANTNLHVAIVRYFVLPKNCRSTATNEISTDACC